MEQFVLPLGEVGRADIPRVGVKAGVLGTLSREGFAVPTGLCLTAPACDLALLPHRAKLLHILGEHDLHEPSAANDAATAMAATLRQLIIPAPIMEQLAAAMPLLGGDDTPLAVRSSAVSEDQEDTSFAGQYATVLGVRGFEAVTDAILTCWRSFFAPHALIARAIAGMAADITGMGVLIQRMVNAECAGVCFTVDPVKQSRDFFIINASWGLGIGIADGSVAADITRFQRAPLAITEQLVVDKPEHVALNPDGGVKRIPVAEERRRAACLPDEWAMSVAHVALVAESLSGRAQDVEWAVADDTIWLLQSRPVTAVESTIANVPAFPISWRDEEERHHTWEIQWFQSAPIPLPLEHDYWDAIFGGFEDAARIVGEGLWWLHKVVNGRTYAAAVPSPYGEGDRRIRAAALMDLAVRLRQDNVTLWDYWSPEVLAACKRLQAFDPKTADDAQVAEHLEDAFGVLRRHWCVHMLLERGQSLLLAPYFEVYAMAVGNGHIGASQDGIQLLEGEETTFTHLIDDLYGLAQVAQAEQAVLKLVRTDPDKLKFEELRALAEANTFIEQLNAFLDAHGERSGIGFGSPADVRTPTWQEEPWRVLRLLAPYLDLNCDAPAAMRSRTEVRRNEQFANLCATCPDQAIVANLQQWWPYARRVAATLEEHNVHIDQKSVAQLRAAIMTAGRRLKERGALGSVEEVFWLARAEVVAGLRATHTPELLPLIVERQAEQARWMEMQPPVLIGSPREKLDPRPPLTEGVTVPFVQMDSRHLIGVGASPGRWRGRARVVPAGTSIPVIEVGEVLVSENAGPNWTPFFPRLGGLVLDQGAMAQHAATTAREYGVPAVIATLTATKQIRDGTWVIVDGDTGTVEMEIPSA